MGLVIREIEARSALTRTGIPGFVWCLNPYVGCTHACRYCYASFMKRFTGHREPWGSFVDAKVNLPEVLSRQLERLRREPVIISSVTDPYQPVEKRYRLTRRCLQALLARQFPVSILTKSSLVLGDLDILGRFEDVEVGLTVTTDNDAVRRIFEPHACPVSERIRALTALHAAGIRTYAFIGPLLPQKPESLARMLDGVVDRIYIDPMNYAFKTEGLYRRLKLEKWLESSFIQGVTARLEEMLPAAPGGDDEP